MNGRIGPLDNDRSDRQLNIYQRWQENIQRNQQKLRKPAAVQNETGEEIRQKIRSGEIECQTCKNRKYVDQSDDGGVSFKTPTHIDPGQSKSAVLGHEQEHVTRNNAKALSEGREVTHSSVTLQYAVCPECGRTYVAGGLTHTVTQNVRDSDKKQEQEQVAAFKAPDSMDIKA